MDRKKWNLLVLAAAEGKSLTPAQFQKVLFLLQKKCPQAVSGYSFSPYDYGPFDATVYHDAEYLAEMGFAQISRGNGGWRTYAATPMGLAKAQAYANEADPAVWDYTKRVVNWARSVSFNELVKAIYHEYPEMKANSIFKE